MRSKLLALLMGFGLAATIAPAMACTFSDSAQSTPTTSQQTAEAQPTDAQPAAAQSGSN